MVDLLVDAKNRLTDLITRYRHRVDYLSIRLESGNKLTYYCAVTGLKPSAM